VGNHGPYFVYFVYFVTAIPHVGALLDLARSVKAAAVDDADSVLEPAVEDRLRRALDMLSRNPDKQYAVLTDATSDSHAVLVTVAIRGRAACEIRIPRDRYDGFLLLNLIDHHSGTLQ
jgi:hypothetical protein